MGATFVHRVGRREEREEKRSDNHHCAALHCCSDRTLSSLPAPQCRTAPRACVDSVGEALCDYRLRAVCSLSRLRSSVAA